MLIEMCMYAYDKDFHVLLHQKNLMFNFKCTKMKKLTVLFMLLLSITSLYAQQFNITGSVFDKKLNEPIIGASVLVKGTSNGTITDMDGKFSLKNVTKGSVLTVSYIGYEPQSITINGNQTSFRFDLNEDSQALDEVVVVGFGTQKKVNLTGAVSTVDTKALEARPVSTVGQALQGTVPGLNFSVSKNGGGVGSRMDVNIRGGGTIGAGSNSSPLVLIDGIAGDMDALNPDDIENISVLKDAAAASVYGSRAPFGVILITTKSGKSGKTVVSYNNNLRWASPINLPEMMDSYTFAQYFNRVSANSGGNPIFDEETIGRIQAYQRGEITTTTVPNPGNGMWELHTRANANVNWLKTHYKDNAFSHDHSLNISGGTEKLNYYISGGFLNQDGNLRFSNDNFKRMNASSKITSQINKMLKIGLNTRFIREELDRPTYLSDDGLFFHGIARNWPTMPILDNNGYYMRNAKIPQLQDGGRHNRTKDAIDLQVTALLTPLKDWNINTEISHRTENFIYRENVAKVYLHDVKGNPVPEAYKDDLGPGSSYAKQQAQRNTLTTINIYSDYTYRLKKNTFKIMAGFNSEIYKTNEFMSRRDDVISDMVPSIDTSMGKDYTSGNLKEWATAGFFGRLNYDFDNRYLFEANIRYDGSSRFLRDKRWNVFPSFSFGWNIAREEFWEPITSVVNTLKPRISWGKLGNQNTESFYPFYPTQPLELKKGGWIIGDTRPTTATAPLMISDLLTWEKVSSTNIGLDFGLFNNRLTGSFEYFIRKTDDMVGPPEEKSAIIGIKPGNLPRINNASLETTGWELIMTWNDRIGKVGYTVGFNISDATRKVTKYPNASKSLSTYYEGQILGDIWGYETIGIAKTDEEMKAHIAINDQSKLGSAWGAGDVMYKDLDGVPGISSGDNTVANPGDRKVIGNSTPRYNFGLNLGADYKGFDFRCFFQGVMKRDVWVAGGYLWGANTDMWSAMGLEAANNYFRPEGDPLGSNVNGYLPKPYFDKLGDKNTKTQSGYLQNGAYMRLKNIQLGYTLPAAIVSKIGLSKLRVYFSADNVFTITKMYKTFDPEAISGHWGEDNADNSGNSGKVYPLSSTLSLGFNVIF